MNDKKCCGNCKWATIQKDNHDTHSPNMEGHRVTFECGRRYARGDDRRDIPCMLTVLERESVPTMKINTSFVMDFYCCYWQPGVPLLELEEKYGLEVHTDENSIQE